LIVHTLAVGLLNTRRVKNARHQVSDSAPHAGLRPSFAHYTLALADRITPAIKVALSSIKHSLTNRKLSVHLVLNQSTRVSSKQLNIEQSDRRLFRRHRSKAGAGDCPRNVVR